MQPASAETFIEVQLASRLNADQARSSPAKAKILYLDMTKLVLWLLLPEQREPKQTRVYFIPRDNNRDEIDLGDFFQTGTYGRLACLQLVQKNIEAIQSSGTSIDMLTAMPGTNVDESLSGTLASYLRRPAIDPAILRWIAWFASLLSNSAATDLSSVIEGHTFDDIRREHATFIDGFVDRQRNLLDDLKQVVESRRLVFLTGGMKSGLTEFRRQFARSLETPSSKHHLLADFEPAILEQIESSLRDNPQLKEMVREYSGEDSMGSLFMSLAFASYRSLRDDLAAAKDPKGLEALDRFMPAAGRLPHFLVRYINDLSQHPRFSMEVGKTPSQIEPLLSFVAALMRSAGRDKYFTIVLPFPKLTDWIRDNRGERAANATAQILRLQFESFTFANFENDTGDVKQGSFVAQFNDRVGILIETQKEPAGCLPEALWRRSVLTIPPFNRAELEDLWRRRTFLPPEPDLIDKLEDATGGAPLLVKLVLECFQCFPYGPPMRRLTEAITNGAIPIVTQRGECLPEVKSIKSDWDNFYIPDLKTRLTPELLSSRKLVFALKQVCNSSLAASNRRLSVNDHPQVLDWLESGLIWAQNVGGVSELHGFEKYPYIYIRKIPTLIAYLISSLTGLPLLAQGAA